MVIGDEPDNTRQDPEPKEKLPGHAAFRQFNNGLMSQGKPADLASTVSLAVGRQRPVENFRGNCG
jgi:hypothetical protein